MDRRRRLAGITTGLALAMGLASNPALAADQDVAISGFSFSPRAVTVRVGDTVTWTNSDAQAHTATSGSAWTTGDIAGGDSASITFRTTGTYDYICAIHPTMTGQVVVRAGTAPATDTAGLRQPDPDEPALTTLASLALVMVAATLVAHRRLGRRAAD